MAARAHAGWVAACLLTLVALVGTASWTGVGCVVYDPALVERDAGPPDASPESCDAAHPPARPTGSDSDGPEMVYALRDVVIDQLGSEIWASTGYDLDQLCTTDPSVADCLPREGGVPELDGINGIDNAFGHRLAPFLLATDPDLQVRTRTNMERGLGVWVLRITGWNGMDDDPRVSVAFAHSVFGTPALPDGGNPGATVPEGGVVYDPPGNPPLPVWDGNDYWWLRDDAFVGGDPARPLIVDNGAWVVGRTLVMALPDRADLILVDQTRSVAMSMTDAHLTARISEDGATLEEVTIAGRWSVDDVLAVAERLGACAGTPTYDLLRNTLNQSSDIRSDPRTDHSGAACDAISLGLEFRGVRARWGGVAPGRAATNACGDAGTPPPLDAEAPMDMDAGLDAGGG